MDERDLPLPLSLDEVTLEWLTAALRRHSPALEIRSFEITQTEFATCTKLWIRLDLDAATNATNIPERVVLKGGFETHSREYYQMHEREVRGYRDVFPVAYLPHPECYFADYDPIARQGIIIMEDLSARGVTFCNALQPQNYNQVAGRLSALAHYHASTWNSPDVKSGGRWSDLVFFDKFDQLFQKYSQPELWNARVALPRGTAMSRRFHDREWMLDAYSKMVLRAHELPQCVLHGDAHLGNTYAYPDGSPGFVDIVTSVGPALLDVTYNIVSSVDIADRRDWEGALIQHYLHELTQKVADAPSFEEAMRQYSMFMVYGYFAWLKNEPHHQIEPIATAVTSRFNAAMLDRDVIGLFQRLP